jgi:hypothetical protein
MLALTIEFLQPRPVFLPDALLGIGTAVISVIFSLCKHFSQIINLLCWDNLLQDFCDDHVSVSSTLRSFSLVSTVRRRTCFLSQTLPVPRNVVTSRCIVVLVGIFVSECAQLNASRTAANNFDAQ